jgi:SecD/SecF fusion protein
MFALIVGVMVGTYSSVFIATPVMYDTQKRKGLDESK